MRRDADRYTLFTRRALLLGGLKVGMLGMLGARLYWLQTIESDKYKVLADDNRINTRPLTPSRGLIFDRTGEPLAANRNNFRVLITADKGRAADAIRQAETVLERLDRVITIGDGERQRIIEQMRRNRSFVPVTVRENLTWEQVAQIEFNAPDLPGVSIDLGQTRDYFYPELMSHIVGYVGRVSPEDLRDSDDAVLQLPGMRIGKKGVEKGADEALRGKPGGIQVEVNAVGRVVRELDRVEGEAGANLLLTIDLELQQYVADRLKDQSASAVVMDVVTGDILSMVSVPSFDNNTFARGVTQTEWQDLLNDPKKPLLNKAAQGVYPPGSTYKMVTALAALDSKAVGLWDRLPCNGFIEMPGNVKKYCWIHPAGHGWLNVLEALQQSCDCFFYEAAKRAGVDRIGEAAAKLGFGRPTGVGLPEESGGLQPSRAWKQERESKPWGLGDTYNLGIGQGDMLSTPLQLAVMTARIANGGYDVQPRLVAASAGARDALQPPPVQTKPSAPSLRFNPQHLKAVQQGMDMVVNSQSGTAFSSRITEKGMAMAGKTGTAQVKRITESERGRRMSQTELPWHLRHHALFCGYAPVDSPRYACAVVVEHGMGGSLTAAPITRDILLQTQKLDPSRRPERFKSAMLAGSGTLAETPAAAGDGPPPSRSER
ncbi:penicillin-binding protein 2 [Vineibacter terrae]|uniref:penicillin-binding protein 2 n=1 Tax=Vineibacter terrae TaxID=2586908 RepID=UPI002E31CA8B|nr:penicillin-binding protein 2 [Vineibacter terrae]HEX2889047.1 penicillin-binding protein 2 [Vineibacter terrae]